MINYLLLVSRQGKLRLAKWFTTMSSKAKAKLVYDITQLVLARKPKMCNVLEYRDTKFITSMFKVIYRRYASLYFICEVGAQENELMTLELIHRYVEVLDRYFGNVCELDLIFNFQQAYTILDELVIGGEMQDSSKKAPLNEAKQVDQFQNAEDVMDKIQQSYLI